MADREGEQQGDADLAAVFANHRRELTCYTRRLLDRAGIPRARLDAEDVVQNAVLKALQKERTEKIHNPRAYLYEVIRNQVRDESRRRNVPLPLDDEAGPGLAASSVKTVDETERAADRVVVHAALSELPRQQRIVVWANKGLQYTHAEIAELLELSLGTVATHARRGLALLGVAVMSWVVTFCTANALSGRFGGGNSGEDGGAASVERSTEGPLERYPCGYCAERPPRPTPDPTTELTPAPTPDTTPEFTPRPLPEATPEFTARPAPDPGVWGLLDPALELWPFLVTLFMLVGLVWAVRQSDR